MRDSNHRAWSNTKTLVVNLGKSTHTVLLRAAARENVDVEVLLERLVEAEYDPDGKSQRQHARTQQAREERATAERHRKLGLTNSSDEAPSISQANEVERLIRLANEVRN